MKENLIKFFNLIKNNKQAKGLLIVGTLLIFIFTLGFSLSMFTSNKKIVIKSHCKESCCCKNCSCIAALDEKENDDNSDDIVIIDEDVRIS